VDEGVRLEPESLHGEGDHRAEERSTGHIEMAGKPSFKPGGDTLLLRHSADSGGMLHRAPALRQGELTEQEEALTWSGGDPVRVSPAGVEEGRLCSLRGFPGEFDQLVLDFKRAQGFKSTEFFYFDWHLYSFEGR
jgi:hypothetical protein